MSEPEVFNSPVYGDKLSDLYKRLEVSAIKDLYKLVKDPGAINFAGGLPQNRLFPISEVVMSTTDGQNICMKNGKNLYLNYMRGSGIEELKTWIEKHMTSMHQPLYHNHRTCITTGSTDGLNNILELLNGNVVICDEFAYASAVTNMRALGRATIGVENDEHGMIPSKLREQCERALRQGLKLDVVYLIPIAQNPTGITMTLERKREIYKVCQEFDLIIIEDDAYYYVYFDDYTGNGTDPYDISSFPGTKNLPASILSMDVDGRVIRLDTVSKFIAPGLRLGWITAPSEFIFKYQLFQEMTAQFPSTVSQSMLLGLINMWGDDGLDLHCKQLQAHYRRQRDVMVNNLKMELGDLYPTKVKFYHTIGGMFLWLTLLDKGQKVTSFDMFKAGAEENAVTVTGTAFQLPKLRDVDLSTSVVGEVVYEDIIDPCSLRISFANPNEEQIKQGIQRLVKGIRSLVIC